jgi:hypothetical protein
MNSHNTNIFPPLSVKVISMGTTGMWDQDIRMQELGAEAMGNPEKKLKPLFTSGSGQKRTQGKSLWNLEGMKYFHRVEKNGSMFMIIRRI